MSNFAEPNEKYTFVRDFLNKKKISFIKISNLVFSLKYFEDSIDEVFKLDTAITYPEICQWIKVNISPMMELYPTATQDQKFELDDDIASMESLSKNEKCKLQLVSDVLVKYPKKLTLLNKEFCTQEIVDFLQAKLVENLNYN